MRKTALLLLLLFILLLPCMAFAAQEQKYTLQEIGRAGITFSEKDAKEDKNNILNAQIALKMLNNQLINPKQVFSFNKAVGPRTTSRGFVVGRSINCDRKKCYYYPDVGGGVCRASTVLHRAVASTGGLKVLERHNHSIPVPYAKPGQDAAVWYGKWDYRFANQRANPVVIKTWAEGQTIGVVLYERVPEKNM